MLTNQLKRWLSMLLALVMILSAVPAPVLAAEADTNDHAEITVTPEETRSQAAQALDDRIGAILKQYGIVEGMTENEIANAIFAADGDTVQATMDEIAVIEEAAGALSEEELNGLENLALYEQFLSVWNQLFMPMPISATVEVLDGQVSITDSVGTGTVSGGTVTITATGSFAYRTQNNITVTNESGSTATLSFDYVVSGYDEHSLPADSGTYTAVLDAGASYEFNIIAPRFKQTVTLTMSNFSLVIAQAASKVTFDYDSTLGSVTVDGAAVSSGDVSDVSFDTGAALVATPVSGATFLGWIDGNTHQLLSTGASYTLVPTEDMTVRAVFTKTAPVYSVSYNTINYLYEDLAAATTKASATSGVVVLANNATLPAGDYTIPAGVTLLIPYNAANTVYTTEPGTLETYTTPTAYRTLTMAAGANLTVNGSLCVSGCQSAQYRYNGFVSGPVGFIKMSENSSIIVNSGANLYAWGYITGSGTVEAMSGAKVYEDFQLADYRGGDGTSGMTDDTQGVFPMSQYYLQNIEVPLKLYAGSYEYAYMSTNVTIIGIQGSNVPVVGNDGAMFKIDSGYIIKDYLEGTGRTAFTTAGDVAVSTLSMTMRLGVLGDTTINSADYNLPIPGHFTVDAVSGSVTMNQDLALLPGSELYIREGVTGVLGEGVRIVVYDVDDWGGYCSADNVRSKQLAYAPGGLNTTGREKDALVQVDGTVDASAGAIYATAGGANVYSTGTGNLIAKKGAETVTYQATQSVVNNSQTITYVEIPITSAKLKNADGTTLTADLPYGKYTYTNGKWIGECAGTHTIATDDAVAPDCTNTGLTAGEHCSVCNKVLTAQEVIAALGHTEVIDAAVAATCTASGLTEGKHCSVCGEVLVAQEEIPATGHTYNAAVTAPTCTEAGYTTYTCHCGDTYVGDNVDALGHTEVIDAAVAAGCETTGLTEGKHCSVCSEVLVAQEEIPATGHDFTGETCANCGMSPAAKLASGEKFAYVAEALAQAAEGETVTMLTDAETGELFVPMGVTLDLNGKTLTAASVDATAAGAKIADSTLGSGLLCVAVDAAEFDPDNGQLPVYDKDGYRFFSVSVELVAVTGKTGANPKYWFRVNSLNFDALYDLIYADAALDIAVEMTWEAGAADATATPEFLKKWADTYKENKSIYITVTAVNTEGYQNFELIPCMKANGVTVYENESVVVEQSAAEEAAAEETAAAQTYSVRAYTLSRSAQEDPCAAGHTAVESEEVPALCDEPGMTAGTYCSVCGVTLSGREEIAPKGHTVASFEAKVPTFNNPGWEAYKRCLKCGYSTYVEIPALERPPVVDFETFVTNLSILEEIAVEYVKENPGKDPVALIIKYIRTGVDRYNSGSWGIMAGYEDQGFAEYVAQMEDVINEEIGDPEYMFCFTNMKDIENFVLPNGDMADFGHLFGTMDITYHNKSSQNHADVAGWTGDLVDLLEFSSTGKVSGTVEEMVQEIKANYLLQTPPDSSIPGMNQLDMNGDLDAIYIIDQLYANEYYTYYMSELFMAYFTEDLTMEDRADYFLKNRLDGVTNRSNVRNAVYKAYTGNRLITTLEGTRDFGVDNLDDLRIAVCYAFADYICKLAGDYVESVENPYYSVFSSTFDTLAPGITQEIKMATSADGKQMVYYVTTADVTRDDVDVFVNYNNNDPSQGWAMQRVLDQANAAQEKYGNPESEYYIPNYNVIASTNGSGFNMSTGEPSGLLVMGGVEYQGVNSSGFFGVTKDGQIIFGTAEDYNNTYKGKLRDGIAGFGATLIRDGQIVASGDTRASRTAIGVTKTGKIVMMVFDGRQEPWSCGGNYEEIAQVMLDAGCVHAINLDGGGSTTYVARQPGDEALSLVNRPSDGFQRSVATSIFVVSTAPSSTAFDHAEIESETDYLTKNTSIQLTPKGLSATGNEAQLPEDLSWAVSDSRWATVTEDGVLTGLRNGTVEVYLMSGETVIGNKTINIVVPDTVYFAKTNIDTVYGATVDLPVKALYQGKAVAISQSDIAFTLSNSKAGTVDGFKFVANADENCGVKNVTVVAALATDETVSGSTTISLYKQGEMTFDFDQATGGDRTLAWYREVSNATKEDNNYIVIDPQQDMVTKYTLAIDMTQIPIPEKLEELTYMLPGSDVEGASAWTFLMQLAQRISTLSEIKAQVQFDQNLDVDISGLTLVNDFFILNKTELDEQTNTVTLTLNWKKQTQAIDPDTANPMCIVSGIVLTPKDDAAWDSKNSLDIVNAGSVSYKIYMRASALYSFSQKEENQKVYGLYDYVNPDDADDRGGYFQDTYKTFEDSYTLVNALKSGWINEDGGFAYYVDGERLTGVCLVEGYYYDFGENGINEGKTKYSGLFENNAKVYYASFGELASGWRAVGEYYYYFSTADFAARTGVSSVAGHTYTFDDQGRLTRGEFVKTSDGVRYYWAGKITYQRWFTLEEGTFWASPEGYVAYGNFPVKEDNSRPIVWHQFDEETGVYIGICDGFFQYQGATYYCENGVVFDGAIQTENGIVFSSPMGKASVDAPCYVNADKCNGCTLQTGWYYADANGYILKDGFANIKGNTYYFTNYVRAKGFTKISDKYYFFNAGDGKMQRDKTLWVGSNSYGIASGNYYFQADGTMYIPDPNGPRAIVEENGKLYFTIDGVKQTNGLNELDGEYYYARTSGELVVNATTWISNFNGLIAPGSGYFAFDAEGKLVKTGFVTGGGNTYYYNNLVRVKGFTKVGEKYYFFNAGSGVMFKNVTLWVSGNNPYGIPSGNYYFQADGSMYVPDPNGEKKITAENGKLYFTIDGVKQKNGLNELDGEYYYARTNGELAVNATTWISNFNGLIAPGSGYFAFDAEGKLVKTGFVTGGGATYYYDNLVRVKGFTKVGEKYYFFNAGSGKMQCDKTLWVGSNSYGVASGNYYFQADGTMYIPDPNGPRAIVEENGKLYFTIDGVKQTNGLNELDGEYYYARTSGELVVNATTWISSFNGLIAPGSGYFAFDAEGKLVKTGFVTGGGATYYYDNLVRVKGFTKVGEKYYFFNAGSGKMQCDKTLWVGSNSYGVASGNYYFQADGTMYIPDPNGPRAIVEENGKLYFTIDGVKQTNGLNELDGEYYYARTSGELVVNATTWISSFNGLIAPGSGYFAFDAEGKLVKTGFVTGSGNTYYYDNLVRVKGFQKIGESYYFFNASSGVMFKDTTLWVAANDYGIKAGSYYFNAEGKMVQ